MDLAEINMTRRSLCKYNKTHSFAGEELCRKQNMMIMIRREQEKDNIDITLQWLISHSKGSGASGS